MCVEHRNLMWTLMLLSLSGAICSDWKVDYQPEHICAVKGSSVTIHCSFYYPDDHGVKRVMWGHEKYIYDGPFIFDSENNSGSSRFEYTGDKKHNCSLKMHQVEHTDTGKYAFRFITDKDGKWTGKTGSMLKVVDLNVSVTKPNGNRATMEGDSVNLICFNGCYGGKLSSVFTWFKNGEALNEGPVLHLSNVSSTDSGNYTCALKTHTGATSGTINIDVEYGPKNTSVSVSPSTEVDAVSNITLICSSRANPPVENYTWFKVDDDDIVDVGHQPVFISGEGGQYFCRASNKHGSQNSSVVTLKIKSYWATFIRVVFIISTVDVLLIVTTVTAVMSFSLNRKRKRALKTDDGEDIQNTEYVNWLTCDNNPSEKKNQCDREKTTVVYATVDSNKKRKSHEAADGHLENEDVIYSILFNYQTSISSHPSPS